MSEATVICSPPPPPPPWPPPPPPQPVTTSAIARTSATEMLPNHLILMNLPLPNYPSSGRALAEPSGPSKCSKERGRGPPFSPPILVERCYVIKRQRLAARRGPWYGPALPAYTRYMGGVAVSRLNAEEPNQLTYAGSDSESAWCARSGDP